MSTTPTNLPVPSEKPQDLKFNAGKIDEFVTSMARQYIDRFGQAHYTIEGLRWVAQQAIAAFGYITLKSFQLGAPLPNNELTLPNQVLQDETDGEYYRWDGTLPKRVPAGSTPDSTGGIGQGAWVSVGDASLRSDLLSEDGAGFIGTTNGKTVQENIDFLEYANGVRISEFLDQPNPVNAALDFARTDRRPVVIDTNLTITTPIVMYHADRIYSFGAFTITKSGNATPSPALPGATAPARNGRVTEFNVDAAIIIAHPENDFARRNVIDGLIIETNDNCAYAIFAPFFAHHVIRNCMFYGFKQGIRSYDAYAHVWEKIYSNYWYSPSGVQEYSDLPCYQIEDGAYPTGTSGTISNVTSIFYRCAWRLTNRNYSTMTNCGGEGVNKPAASTSVPYVFELINCNDIVLNSPHTENLNGGFFKIVNDNTAATRGGTIVINGPQANAGIRGTSTNVGAKLFDVSGNANVLVNGGYLTPGATGFYLDFYKVTGDSYLRFIGTDMRFLYNNISSDTGVYDGVMKIDSIYPPEVVLSGVNTTSSYTGVVPFNIIASVNDRYNQTQNTGYIRTAIPGIYEIEASISFPTGTGNANVGILNAATPTDTGSTLKVVYHVLSSTGKTTATVKWKGRLTSNRYIYITVTGSNAQSSSNSDTSVSVKTP